jgi:hypothetical protein
MRLTVLDALVRDDVDQSSGGAFVAVLVAAARIVGAPDQGGEGAPAAADVEII